MSAITLPTMPRRTASRLLLIAVPLLLGALTRLAVAHLPAGLAPLANSAAPWVLVALCLALTARRRAEAVLIGVLALVGLVVGFYVAQSLHGWAVDSRQLEFWSVGSVVFGVPIGLAADGLTRSGAGPGAAGAGAIGGMLVGEAVHALTSSMRWYTPHTYWHVQLGLGLGLAVAGTAWAVRRGKLAPVPALGLGAGAGLVLALLTWAAYTFA